MNKKFVPISYNLWNIIINNYSHSSIIYVTKYKVNYFFRFLMVK
jgi:hypothetical protein